MAWFIGQSAVMIVLAFLLGLLVGWLIWHQRSQDTASSGSAADEPAAPKKADQVPPVFAAAAPVAIDTDPVSSNGAKAAAQSLVAEAVPLPRGGSNAERDAGTKASIATKATAPEPVTEAASAEPSGKPATKGTAKKATEKKAKVEAVAVVPTPVHDEPEPAPIDDLARIEGIGPKIAGALVDAGIRSYDQLADADQDTIRAAINTAGIKFAPSITTWSQQARLLADGDEAAFTALTDRLIAGRDVPMNDVPMNDMPMSDVPIDDLARIEGIGPKIAGALVDAGIRSYGQLADADQDTIRAAINTAGIKFAPSITTWSQQARLLADGDEAGFTDLTLRLVAGRDETGEHS